MVLIKKLLVFKGIVLQKYNIDKQLQALILIKFIISNFFIHGTDLVFFCVCVCCALCFYAVEQKIIS